jgi:hypothetical protein
MAKKIQWSVNAKWVWKWKDIPEEKKNALLQLDEFKGMEELPNEIVYFEWVVSNGDKNRNGYTIESKAWFFENSRYVKDFLKTWSVLDNHNDDKPIWRPLVFELDSNWNDINAAGYAWDDLAWNKIWRKLVLGLSTGHITHESVYEHTETKQRIKANDFWNLIWEDIKIWRDYVNWMYEWIVTKAEIVEYSFVPVRSNRGATLTNWIWPDQENFGINIPKNTTKEQAKILFFNQFAMKKYKKNADGTDMLDPITNQPIPEDEGGDDDGGSNGDDTIPPAWEPTTPSDDTTNENSIKLNGVVVETNELQKLVNFIAKEVEKNFTDKIKGLEDENKNLTNSLEEVKTSLNALKDSQREWLNALVPNGTDGKQEEKTIASIIKNKNEAKASQ